MEKRLLLSLLCTVQIGLIQSEGSLPNAKELEKENSFLLKRESLSSQIGKNWNSTGYHHIGTFLASLIDSVTPSQKSDSKEKVEAYPAKVEKLANKMPRLVSSKTASTTHATFATACTSVPLLLQISALLSI